MMPECSEEQTGDDIIMLETLVLTLVLLSSLHEANGSCAVGQYRCKNIVPESCINTTLVGDGHADCADNSDEEQTTCAKQSSFVCSGGTCIPLTYRFDNTSDCPYGIDEVKYLGDWCDPTHTGFSCSRYTNNSECVNSSCTCEDGWTQTDYQTCLRASSSCSVGYYGCKNIVPESCINATLVGDGHADCADNSDEVQVTCAKINYFVCTTGVCIPLAYRFDNKADCPDGVDEVKYLGDWCDPTHTGFSCSGYTNNSECVNSSCTCKDGWTQTNYQTCQRGSSYTPSIQASNSTEHTTSTLNQVAVQIEESCVRDTDCSKAVNNSECRNSLCVCIQGYVEEQNSSKCSLNVTFQNPGGTGIAGYSKALGQSPIRTSAIIAIVIFIAVVAVGIVGIIISQKKPKLPVRSTSMYRQATTISRVSRRTLSFRQINEQFGINIAIEDFSPSTPPANVSYPVLDVTGVDLKGGK